MAKAKFLLNLGYLRREYLEDLGLDGQVFPPIWTQSAGTGGSSRLLRPCSLLLCRPHQAEEGSMSRYRLRDR